jgi:hypothetical protein
MDGRRALGLAPHMAYLTFLPVFWVGQFQDKKKDEDRHAQADRGDAQSKNKFDPVLRHSAVN